MKYFYIYLFKIYNQRQTHIIMIQLDQNKYHVIKRKFAIIMFIYRVIMEKIGKLYKIKLKNLVL